MGTRHWLTCLSGPRTSLWHVESQPNRSYSDRHTRRRDHMGRCKSGLATKIGERIPWLILDFRAISSLTSRLPPSRKPSSKTSRPGPSAHPLDLPLDQPQSTSRSKAVSTSGLCAHLKLLYSTLSAFILSTENVYRPPCPRIFCPFFLSRFGRGSNIHTQYPSILYVSLRSLVLLLWMTYACLAVLG